MLCNYPFTVIKPDGSSVIVPCNNCIGCKIAHSREWAFRLLCEFETRKKGVFVTLTYDNEHRPYHLVKSHLTAFLKALRRSLKLTSKDCKYFGCGEYGDRFGREHYHAIILGVDFSCKEKIIKLWPYGRIHVGNVTADSARYVAGYIDKKYANRKNKEVYGDYPPFQVQSQGIGLSYFLKHFDDFNDGTLRFKRHVISTPRYFVRKFGLDCAGNSISKHSQESTKLDSTKAKNQNKLAKANQAERNTLNRKYTT